jgi:ATP-dependent helicase HrpA
MKESTARSGQTTLDGLLQELDDCLARDIPALKQKINGLRRRVQRGQPVERGLAALHKAMETSRQQVRQRSENLPRPVYALPLPVVEQREALLEK